MVHFVDMCKSKIIIQIAIIYNIKMGALCKTTIL
jgi:hypothetical protein